MEPSKKIYQYDNIRTSYTDGSSARKLGAVPDRRREQYEPAQTPRREQPAPKRRVQQQPKQLCSINSLASLLVLTAAIIATFYFCVEYLQLQNNVSLLEKDIVKMETSLLKKKNDNDATYALINSAIDLENIYTVAVEELGMVYPNNNTVITYESSDIGYVRQYQDIPE